MTDKSLLELAAKAVGKTLELFYDGKPITRDIDGQPVYWNPLANDGDALRLAVNLRLGTLLDYLSVSTYAIGRAEVLSFELHGNDPYAATRRAIVRAAAEIGRTK